METFEILAEIDHLLSLHHREIFETLQPPASQETFDLFKSICLDGQDIPDDLQVLYSWHNGQKTNYESLNPSDNRTFLPLEEVIDSWKFLNDPEEDILEPISRSWIPITHNGAGDYLMYNLDNGTLLNYWHDWEDRSVDYRNIHAWLLDIAFSAQNAEENLDD